jgi:hypothetical protein
MIRGGSQAATGTSRDLLLRWRAPSEVVEVLSHDRDEIADLPGTPRLQLRDSGVAAAESRRPWIHYGLRGEDSTGRVLDRAREGGETLSGGLKS